jgi:hypothetical protein
MGLSGDIGRISDLKKKIQELPTTIAVDVAARAAPEMTTLTREAFAAGQTVYGEARPLGVDGKPLTLKKTGAVEKDLEFKSDGGTKIRAVIGEKYAKYLIGKYKILPIVHIPAKWSKALQDLVASFKVPP